MGWIASGDPDQWPLIFVSCWGARWLVPRSLVEVLNDWCRGAEQAPGLYPAIPRGDPLDSANFESFGPGDLV